MIGGEPTDPRYARENVGKELEDDSLKELREALSGNLGDGTDDDDDYEPPASMSEAIDEFMAKQEAPLREALGGETHSLPHRSIPEGIDLETEEGAAKFMEVLSSYKMSARDDFKELPPTLDRHGYSYSYGDRNGDYYKSLEEGYQNFSVALTAMRTGQTDQLNVEERAIASDYEDEFKRLNEAADTAYKGVAGDRDTRAWRSITDYGEEGNQVNDAIMQNMMIQYAGDSNPYFRKDAYNHINADVIHNDGIDSSEAWERYMGDVSPDELSKLGLKPEVELNKLRHQLYAEKYGDALKPGNEDKLKREVRKYLKGQIDSGKVEFDATSKEFKASKREPVKQYNEAEDMKRILSGNPDISPETRVSIMNSARRKRDMITAQADQFAGAFEPRITEYNPVASRRVNWNSESVKVADAEKGNLIISNTPNNDGTRDTYVVVDDKKGLMVQIRENLTPMDRLSDPDGSRASAFQATTSEYAIQNVLRRYEMEDQTLNVQPISDKNRYGDKLHVW